MDLRGSGQNYIMKGLVICTAHPIFFCDQIEKNEMCVVCSTCGGKERCIKGFGLENTWKEQLEDPEIDGRILGRIFRRWDVVIRTGSSWLVIGTGGGHL